MVKYVIIYEDESNDHEMPSSTTIRHKKFFESPNVDQAIAYYQKFVKDCNETNECADAMGGGCFSFSTNFIGLRAVGCKDWIIKDGESMLEPADHGYKHVRRRSRVLPSGDIEYADEYGGY